MEKEKEIDLQEEKETLDSLQLQNGLLTGIVEAGRAEIAGLKQAVTARDSEIEELKQSLEEAGIRGEELNAAFRQAVGAYKGLVLKANPAVPVEMLTGDTIGAVDESLEKTRALVEKIRGNMEAEAAKARVPAGAPIRMPVDISGLSAREKIKYAMEEG